MAHGDAIGHGDRGEFAGVPHVRERRAMACAWRASAMLQGAASFHVETTPTSGCAISSSVVPIA